MAPLFNHVKFALFTGLIYLNYNIFSQHFCLLITTTIRLIITLNKFFSDISLYFYDDYKESVGFACSWSF